MYIILMLLLLLSYQNIKGIPIYGFVFSYLHFLTFMDENDLDTLDVIKESGSIILAIIFFLIACRVWGLLNEK